MKSFLSRLIACFTLIIFVFVSGIWMTSGADAAPRKKSKGGLSQEQIENMNKDLNNLTRKIYANSLFSPKDNETMINIKLNLDEAMLKSASPEYAPLYYMEANLLKKRNYKNEAIECYQTIIENFADTAFAPKAKQELIKMGVKIEMPIEEEELEE